ncbi:MAG: glycine cleavage system aminomethyltransferase GcvT [Rhodobacteraceae bacterium]|nr:glycine cleavage system aminomethyltransferase GcvT [Paracoccaceae bacterium]
MTALAETPLTALHAQLGARMIPFAGYSMPVQYPMGVMGEHVHTRRAAGLFDIGHMGQVRLHGNGAAAALEALIPGDIAGLPAGRQRYGFFTNDAGGLLDDLMLANRGDHILMVTNAARKDADIAHMCAHMPAGVTVDPVTDRGLIALQGPCAETVLHRLNPAAKNMAFMDVTDMELLGQACWVSRSGYTGEDGYEISVPAAAAEPLARALLQFPEVAPVGLGARDSLRLEAGLCLYGHDIDAKTTPVEAGLAWAIGKVRRTNGTREGGFPGAGAILGQLVRGTRRRRVGLLPEGRAPMRAGVALFADDGAEQVGAITSGGFGPTVGRPVAMGYVPAALSVPGSTVYGALRGKRLPLTVATLPFRPANFKR